MSLVWSLDRVTQMDGLVYYAFHFVEKKKSWTRSEELQGLTSCTQGRRIFCYPHVICFWGLHRKNCFKMEWYSFCFYIGANQESIIDQMGQPAPRMIPSEFYKNRYIQRYRPATNWILCLCFWCGPTVCHWWRFCLFAVNYILNFYSPRLIKLAKI